MTDFQVKTESTGQSIDTRWRASKHGEDIARPGQLDLSKFDQATHYPNGIIPSGTGLYETADGRFGPFDPAGGADENAIERVLAGYVNDDSGVVAVGKPTFARLVHGVINASRLPIAGQRAAVATAKSTGSFIYVKD